jgi:dihydrofolate reductase
MRKLVVKMSMSLDGFVNTEAGDGMWALRASTPDSAAWVRQTLMGAGAHLLGRKSFEAFAGYWPTSPSPLAAAMNDTPKVVFTRQKSLDPSANVPDSSPASSRWAEARVANGDLEAEIASLKDEPGEYLLAQAGTGFCNSLVRAGLVDEYRIVLAPVALGSGVALFADLAGDRDLSLVSSTAFDGGVVGLVYRPKD